MTVCQDTKSVKHSVDSVAKSHSNLHENPGRLCSMFNWIMYTSSHAFFVRTCMAWHENVRWLIQISLDYLKVLLSEKYVINQSDSAYSIYQSNPNTQRHSDTDIYSTQLHTKTHTNRVSTYLVVLYLSLSLLNVFFFLKGVFPYPTSLMTEGCCMLCRAV